MARPVHGLTDCHSWKTEPSSLYYDRTRGWRPLVLRRGAAQRVRRCPKGHTATAAKARLILRPVRHFDFHLTDVMAAAGVMFLRHAGSINLVSVPAASMQNVEI